MVIMSTQNQQVDRCVVQDDEHALEAMNTAVPAGDALFMENLKWCSKLHRSNTIFLADLSLGHPKDSCFIIRRHTFRMKASRKDVV